MPSPRITKGDRDGVYFITLTVLEWINIFTKKEYFHVLRDSLRFCIQNKGLLVYEYVFMTNHIHMIIGAREDGDSIDEIVWNFKKFTTHEFKKLIENDNRNYVGRLLKRSYFKRTDVELQVWQKEHYAETIFSEKFRNQKSRYIWMNPVKEEYVLNPEDWYYSSARQKILGLDAGCEEVAVPCAEWDI
jgi:putative transposase